MGTMPRSFNFESQFVNSEKYYKSQAVLRLVNEEIKLAELYGDFEELDTVVTFCDANGLEIVGVEVKEYSRSGGDSLSAEEIAGLLLENFDIESNGHIVHYAIFDNRHGMAPSIFCVHDDSFINSCGQIPEKEFKNLLSKKNLEFELLAILRKDEKKGFRDPLELLDPHMTISADELMVDVSKVDITTVVNNSWKDVGYVERSPDSSGNSWVFDSEEVKKYQENGLEINPVITLSMERASEILGVGIEKFQGLKDFTFPLFSILVYGMQEAIEEGPGEGICLNCLSTEITAGDLVSCWRCGNTILMIYDEPFPVDDGLINKVRDFVHNIVSSMEVKA